ncbi:MAG TPA: hypothetical protein VF401_01500 [Candidatus Saccharimonadales bacterium]
MARLPKVGGDDGNWGQLLNDFLSIEHNIDGTLKNVARPSDLAAISAGGIADGAVTSSKLADGAVTNIKITDGTIASAKLTSAVQTSLGKADSAVQSVNGHTGSTVTVTASDVGAVSASQVGVSGGVAALSSNVANQGKAIDAYSGSPFAVPTTTDPLTTLSSGGATPSIDVSQGTVQDLTLTANATISFTGATTGRAVSFLLILRQDSTGSRTVTWPASVKWSIGTAPTLSSGAGKVDMLTFVTVDGGTTWYGALSGVDLR